MATTPTDTQNLVATLERYERNSRNPRLSSSKRSMFFLRAQRLRRQLAGPSMAHHQFGAKGILN